MNILQPQVMAIVNLTPDSFFDGGNYTDSSLLHQRIDTVISDGADIIDLGAYSTRPGAEEVPIKEEWKRLKPALEHIKKHHPNVSVSIDTFRSEIGERAGQIIGKFIVNDISGGTLDRNLFHWVAKNQMPYILMHIKGTPQTMQQNPHYEDIVTEVYNYFIDKIHKLKTLGVRDIIIDPGFGFGKTITHNYTLLKRLNKFQELQCPILAGISRKSMIYKVLDNSPKDALNGTTALNMLALLNGAKILRVHDVKQAKEVITLHNTLQNS